MKDEVSALPAPISAACCCLLARLPPLLTLTRCACPDALDAPEAEEWKAEAAGVRRLRHQRIALQPSSTAAAALSNSQPADEAEEGEDGEERRAAGGAAPGRGGIAAGD